MIISIHDVPTYERHLLNISGLGQPRRRRPAVDPMRREVQAINRSLSIHDESVAAHGLLPYPLGVAAPAQRGAA